MSKSKESLDTSGRRRFLKRAAAGTAAAIAATTVGLPAAEVQAKGAGANESAGLQPGSGVASGTHQGYTKIEEVWGPQYSVNPYTVERSSKASGLPAIVRWNQISIDASGLDHKPVSPGED